MDCCPAVKAMVGVTVFIDNVGIVIRRLKFALDALLFLKVVFINKLEPEAAELGT